MNNTINQAITGICSFGKFPICTNLDDIGEADMAVLGVPYDLGVGFLSGARLGPRRIREASTQYGRGDAGFYDFEDDEQYLAAPLKIVDCGDADILQGDLDYSFSRIEYSVRKIIENGTIPIVLGGDHSISIPVGRALKSWGKKISIIQFDAHLDWTDHVGPQAFGNGSPMRRLSEMDHIDKMVQIGLRGIGSGKRSDYMDAKNYGSTLISAREAHAIGVQGVLDKIPDSDYYFISFDIDGYDMSIAPGVASPYPGGLFYDQVLDIFKGICKKGKVVGIDMVEVAPQYDPSGITVRLAALTLINMMAQIGKIQLKK